MKNAYTKDEMKLHIGSSNWKAELEILFSKNNNLVSIDYIFESEIDLRTKKMFIYSLSNTPWPVKYQLVLKLAWKFLPVFEERYPNDFRVRDCLEAVEEFKNGNISKEDCKDKIALAYSAAMESSCFTERQALRLYEDAYKADGTIRQEAIAVGWAAYEHAKSRDNYQVNCKVDAIVSSIAYAAADVVYYLISRTKLR